jgi:hypothetical protein
METGHEGSIIGSDDEDDEDDERGNRGDKAKSSSRTRLVQSRRSEDINPDESDKNDDIAVRDFGDKKPPVSTDTISAEPEPPATSTAPGPPEGESHPFPFKQPPTAADIELGNIASGPDAEAEIKYVEEQVKYFAVPGGPGVRKRKLPGEDDPDAFFHPATKDPQRIIWLPRDQLGLADDEIERNAAAGVQSTNLNAVLNGKVSGAGEVEHDLGQRADVMRKLIWTWLTFRRARWRSREDRRTICKRTKCGCGGLAPDNCILLITPSHDHTRLCIAY